MSECLVSAISVNTQKENTSSSGTRQIIPLPVKP